MAKTPIQTQDIDQGLSERLDNVVESSYIDVPHTEITNRAKIRDFASDLRPRLGVERIHTSQIELAEEEIGPDNKTVFRVKDDLLDRIRLVGTWRVNDGSDNRGARIANDNADDFIEISFYGTGLNALPLPTTVSRDERATVDGGTEGADFYPTSTTVLLDRNYRPNQVVSIVSGLTLGFHTVKIRRDASSAGNGSYFGFEILNETAQLVTTPGASYKGADRRELTALDTQAYDSDFESEEGTPGTKGGRVVVYQDKDGNIKKNIRWTESSQLNLSSADHTNEELIRKYYPIQFGKGRDDDLSTLGNTIRDAAFTLEDGTTTIVGEDVRNITGDGLLQGNVGDFYTLTFVGTGLDVFALGTYGAADIIIDGSAVGSLTGGGLAEKITRVPIVSGLPYGTHTVKFDRQVSFITTQSFLTYGPKKPTLPADAVELGDYFLMADYVINSNSSVLAVSQGIINKAPAREFIYEGSPGPMTLQTGHFHGNLMFMNNIADAAEYTFFGTGFEIDARDSGGTGDAQISIDGVLYTGAATVVGPSAGSWTPGSSTWDIDGSDPENNKLVVTGLSLGIHTVRFEVAAGVARLRGINIITPIHTPSFDTEIEKQQIVGASGGGVKDLRQLVGKETLKTREQQIEDGEIIFTHAYSGARISGTHNNIIVSGNFRPYKENGRWFTELQIHQTHSPGTTVPSIDVAGVEFSNYVALASSAPSLSTTRGWTDAGTNGIALAYGTAQTESRVAGNLIQLAYKPFWAV